MKFLLDSEIMDWNNRLKNTNFMVDASYGVINSHPIISFRQNKQTGVYVNTIEPYLEFQFSFSVVKNRVDIFWNIFNNWYENKVGNKTFFEDNYNSKNTNDIVVDDSIINNKSEITHSILGKEYVRYTYNFKGKLASIMAYVMFLEDSIQIFSSMYGYTEDGTEVSLSKFQIGSMVCLENDKSKDYLIVDVSPVKIDRKFHIKYHISEVLVVGDIIKYGDTQVVSENSISFSRNYRIDDILDN